jgi:hypothetical protein
MLVGGDEAEDARLADPESERERWEEGAEGRMRTMSDPTPNSLSGLI